MNNLMLLGSEYNNPRRFRREPWSNQSNKVTGVRVFWGTPEGKAKWQAGLSFKAKRFHRIHSLVHHDGIGGHTQAWQRAAKLLESKMAQFECQAENY